MKNEIVESIIEVEKQAEMSLQKAQEEALNILSKNENEIEKLKEKSIQTEKQRYNNLISSYETQMQNEYDEEIKEYIKRSEEIEKKAKKKLPEVIELLLMEVVNDS